MNPSSYQRAVLIILDGFGIGKNSPWNAIQNAKMPFYQSLMKQHPHSELLTHGEAVGLPSGIMGNSEIGHMTLGAGRIIYPDLTKISKSIQSKDFFQNPVLLKALQTGAQQHQRIHLLGLLSEGGVHSHLDHLLALIDLCRQQKIPQVCLHLILDGRDTPPQSAGIFLKKLFQHSESSHPQTKIVLTTLMGRYWAMDRDQRWERIEKAYRAIIGQQPVTSSHPPDQLLEQSYSRKITDEFFEPLLLSQEHALKTDESLIFFNFRSDRARELTRALSDPQFSAFQRNVYQTCQMTSLTQYDRDFHWCHVAYPPQNMTHLFGEWLQKHQLSQFRIAETEKYAHVTFFFNGGRELPFHAEHRILIPSTQEVPTYDLRPEMSALQITQTACQRIEGRTDHFVLVNFANADMVGHTGHYSAAVLAVETLDRCLEKIILSAQKEGYHVLVTADHGNAEEMQDLHGQPHTQHTLNPVPALWIAPQSTLKNSSSQCRLKEGTLADIMPTLCELMKLPIPPEVTGASLLPRNILC